MKIKEKFIKAVLLILLGSAALNLSFGAMIDAVIHPDIEKNNFTCFPSEAYKPPDLSFTVISAFSELKSNPFQIFLILFLISPPIIVAMLVLFWKRFERQII